MQVATAEIMHGGLVHNHARVHSPRMARDRRDYRKILQATLDHTKMSQEEYAAEIEVEQGTVSRWVRGLTRKIEEDNKQKIIEMAQRYGVAYDRYATDGPCVPVKGRIIVNGQVEPKVSDNQDINGGDAPMVDDATRDTVALVVEGNSMWPAAWPGWLVYYDDQKREPTDDVIGTMCVVKLRGNGKMFVRIVEKGLQPGTWMLIPVNGAVERDQELEWAQPVKWIRPRKVG